MLSLKQFLYMCLCSHDWHAKLMSVGFYSCASGDCVYYKLTGFSESSSSFKLIVSGCSPGSFDVGHSILCSVFSASAVFRYSHLLPLLCCVSFVDSQIFCMVVVSSVIFCSSVMYCTIVSFCITDILFGVTSRFM